MNNKVKNSGELNLAGYIIPCYVTEDGTRLLSGSKMQEALKISSGYRAGTRIEKFLSKTTTNFPILQYIPEGLLEPITCFMGNKKIKCYKAETLIGICSAFIKAREEFRLTPKQYLVYRQCAILIEAFANVGLIALIDEATGYQAERDNTELQRILAAYISNEVAKWQLTFSSEFYRELYRLYNIPESSGNSKPLRVGKITNDLIYKELPNGVLEALKERTGKTENGNWQHKLHQSLTPDIGRQHLKNQIIEVTTLMSVSNNREQFKQLFNRRYHTQEIREAI